MTLRGISAEPGARPIRLAVVLGSRSLSKWDAFALRQIRDLPFVTIPIAVAFESAENGQPPAQPLSMISRFYLHLDRRLQMTGAMADAVPLLADAKWLFAPKCQKFLVDCVEQLKRQDLDVVLQLGYARPLIELADAAPLGVWFCQHGKGAGPNADSFAWEAISNGESTVESTLESVATDTTRVLCKSVTSADQCFPHRTALRIYWKAASFPTRALTALHYRGLNGLGFSEQSQATPQGNAHYVAGRTQSVVVPMVRSGIKIAVKSVRNVLGRESWLIGLRRRKISALPDFERFSSAGFVTVHPDHKGLLADPFLIEHEGREYIFCEELLYNDRRGVISWMEILNDGTVTSPRSALRRPYHLSYPFLIRAGGELFMIPETARSRNIELYRCVRFPDQWELDSILMAGVAAVDTTILEAHGKYWLFTCLKEEVGDTADDLHLYWADSLRGPWRAHPLNPVVSDVRNARPAGNIVRVEGALIRPSQDCSKRYGWRIKYNRILALSESDYKEETIGSTGASWCDLVNGAHTWNCSERFEVIDGRVWQPRGPFRRTSRHAA